MHKHCVKPPRIWVLACLVIVFFSFGGVAGRERSEDAQEDVASESTNARPGENVEIASSEGAESGPAKEQRVGYRIKVPLPIRGDVAESVCGQLERLAEVVGTGNSRRTTVVLEFEGDTGAGLDGELTGDSLVENGRGSEFEEALRIARCVTGRVARQLKLVAYVRGDLRGHAMLIVLACDELVVAPAASVGDAAADEKEVDQAIMLVYQSIAAGRAIVPEAAVRAIVDSGRSLYQVTELGGEVRFVDDLEAAALRSNGAILKEQKLSDAGRPSIFSGQQLRDFRWASQLVDRPEDLASQLGLARLIEPDGVAIDIKAVRMEVRGAINNARVRRFRANLTAAFESRQANSVYVELDSAGGDLGSSLELGLELSGLRGKSGRAFGFVEGEARGDALLIAAACRPLFMHPQAMIGSGGAATYASEDVRELRDAINQLATESGRPAALLIGLLDPTMEVYRYTQRRTGQVAFFIDVDLDEVERGQWIRGERIELAKGLTAAEAIELGLAEGEAETSALAATQAGLEEIPPRMADRKIVRAVEWLGGLPWLGPLLVFIGFMALSMEMSAPGLGVPGFVSLVCFLFFFWMKFLSGTAEWLEVVLFFGGVMCILVEVLLVPGVGVFGIGGLLMVIAAILLVSQTFVIPTNDYQFTQTARGLFSVLAACVGVVVGLVALRFILPGTPMFRHLVMPGPNSDEMIEQEQREHLVHYDALMGQRGKAITPLRPSGKAMFGEMVVAVISDGSPMSKGDAVRVVEVHGNRIVVEPV